jgi:hypothetical protein
MNRDLAKHVATATVSASTQLTSVLPLLKAQCDSTEYARLARGIASACGHIAREILHPIFAEHPDLEKELEESITKYGKVL